MGNIIDGRLDLEKKNRNSTRTKEKILLTAIELFNKYTASAISTNHIAAEMNISPGNLYYYFKNKEEIIKEIFLRLAEGADRIWYNPELGKTEESLIDYFKNLASHMYAFRFFYLELNVLLKNDPELRKTYMERADRIIQQMKLVFAEFIRHNIMKNFESERERIFLLRNIWTVGQMWMTYSNLKYDNITPEIVNDGVWQMYTVVERLITKKSKIKIEKILYKLFPI